MNIKQRKDLKEAEKIITIVCELLNITYYELQSSRRKQKDSEARFIVSNFLKKAGYMTCQIAELLMRHRTTVLYFQKQYKNLVDTEWTFSLKAKLIETEL